MAFPNGAVTRIVSTVLGEITDPTELGALEVQTTVYVADVQQPLWPGSVLVDQASFVDVVGLLADTNAERYEILYPA